MNWRSGRSMRFEHQSRAPSSQALNSSATWKCSLDCSNHVGRVLRCNATREQQRTGRLLQPGTSPQAPRTNAASLDANMAEWFQRPFQRRPSFHGGTAHWFSGNWISVFPLKSIRLCEVSGIWWKHLCSNTGLEPAKPSKSIYKNKRRKFNSQTSGHMQGWKAKVRKFKRREK